MQGVFTKFLQLWIPNKTDKGSVVTDVFEPNFTKLDQNAETTNQTLTNLSNNKLDKGTYSGDAGKLKEDIDEKMSKYQIRYDIMDYDDIPSDGFYVLNGRSAGIANSPHYYATLVQVWKLAGFIYQRAVSPYEPSINFVRCFKAGVKNTMWTTSCPYSVGDIYHTTRNEHPAVIWPFTTWEKIEGRFLLATSGSNASGQTGGSNIKTIAKANLPNIKLQVDSFTLTTQPHTHPITYRRGTGIDNFPSSYESSHTDMNINTGEGGGQNTGTASPYTSALGSGTPLDITPAYYTVHIWKRLT